MIKANKKTFYLELLDGISDMVCAIDKHGNLVYTNSQWMNTLGYSRQKLAKMVFRDVVCPDFLSMTNKIFEKFVAGKIKRKNGIGITFCSKDNEKIEVEGNLNVIRKDNNLLMVCIFRNTVEQQSEICKLSKNKEYYRTLFDDSPISLWEEDFSELKIFLNTLKKKGIKNWNKYFNQNLNIVKKCVSLVKVKNVNQATLTLYDAKNKESFFKFFSNIFNEESQEAFIKQLIVLIKGGVKFGTETVNYKLSGQKMHVLLKWSIAPEHVKKLDKIFVSVIDITQSKEDQEKLQQHAESLEKMNRFMIDRELKMIDLKKKLKKLSG